uniref:Uncharacterized protein n=1 Tax=Siphoviridae sp. ctLqe90 TaxID=2825456 RepID=A0A8S5Q3U3_9CAUD|nr:MAG TPA: hypothetical protein [Siphoviridae sp. ctLqe90]DAG35970.1 MAG TPA: hypothetical protein [Caudoviricetes sp.]DAZ23776.1 MAG TPA: hypothetical protein [Caudoviricetes sp.]
MILIHLLCVIISIPKLTTALYLSVGIIWSI